MERKIKSFLLPLPLHCFFTSWIIEKQDNIGGLSTFFDPVNAFWSLTFSFLSAYFCLWWLFPRAEFCGNTNLKPELCATISHFLENKLPKKVILFNMCLKEERIHFISNKTYSCSIKVVKGYSYSLTSSPCWEFWWFPHLLSCSSMHHWKLLKASVVYLLTFTSSFLFLLFFSQLLLRFVCFCSVFSICWCFPKLSWSLGSTWSFFFDSHNPAVWHNNQKLLLSVWAPWTLRHDS